MKLEGLIPPMVTPLDERRRLDKAGVRNMVNHLLKGGVDGIFLLAPPARGRTFRMPCVKSSSAPCAAS